jgi:hypothetical protein
VGIGISPSYPLHITAATGQVYLNSSTGTNYVRYSLNNTGGGFQYGIDNSAGSNFFGATPYGRAIFSDGAYPIGIFTNGTLRLTIPSDAGGIKFPATQVASSDANTLDDYEEGTWTPSVGGTATYTGNRAGSYIKVGGLVYVSMILQITLLGTGSAGTVTGLPFACNAGPRNTLAFGYFSGVVGNIVFLSSYVGNGGSDIKFLATTSATSGVSDGYGLLSNGAYIMVSGCYYAS